MNVETDEGRLLAWCRQVFSASHDPYALLDADGRYVWFNEAGASFFGYAPEEIVGRHFRDHLVQGEPSGTTFAHAAAGTAGSVTRHVRRGDGTTTPVRAELLPVGGGWVLVHGTDMREVLSDIRQLRSTSVLDALLESTSEAVVLLDSEFRIMRFNPVAAAYLHALNGQEMYTGQPFPATAPNGDAETSERTVASAFAGQRVERMRTFRDVQGNERSFRIRAFPLAVGDSPPLGVAFTARDVTEIMEARRIVRERSDLLRRAEQIAGVGAWTYRLPHGQIEWTDGMYRLFDLPPDLGPNLDVEARLHPEDRERVRSVIEQRLAGVYDVRHQVYRVLLPSGEVRWLEEFVTLDHDATGIPIRLSGTLQDITSRILAEQQAIEVEKTEAVTRLVAGVAHDLNNALHSIIGPIDIARSGAHDPERWLGMAQESAERAAAVVRQLMLYVGRIAPRPTRFSFREMVAEAISTTRVSPVPTFDPAGVTAEVTADRAQLVQVIASLLLNASEATQGKRTEAAFVPSIHLTLRATDESVSVSVRNNGVGMDDHALRHAFDPYFSTKQSGHGVGLGLALVRRIVRDHAGEIAFQSEPGSGTTITITLPRSVDSDFASSRANPGGAPRILVVDDDPAISILAASVLESAGYVPTAVSNGDAAIEACRLEEFDLVLLNLQMPGRDGWSTLAALGSEWPSLRVVLMTGSDLGERPAPDGAAGVIQKPWTVNGLLEAVGRILTSLA